MNSLSFINYAQGLISATSENQGNYMPLILMFVVFIGIFYVFSIRPQQIQMRETREMLSKLKVGDKIETIGGIFGVITKVSKDTLLILVADKVEIELRRSAVRAPIKEENQEAKGKKQE